MELRFGLVFSIVFCFNSFNSSLVESFEIKNEFLDKNEARCAKYATNPYFDFKMVAKRPWRIYYSWDMDLGNKCIDYKFIKATSRMVDGYFKDMASHLQEQPMWETGRLQMSMGSHKMMLFVDLGSPIGRFTAVANVRRDGNLVYEKGALPLVKFFMKFYREGKYLFILDCSMGVATLSTRFENPPDREEIEAVAKEVGMESEGEPACLQDQNAMELFKRS